MSRDTETLLEEDANTTEDPDELTPRTLVDGRYRVEYQLSAGGVGIVYKARNIDLERDVVLKTLHHRGKGKREQLRRKAVALAKFPRNVTSKGDCTSCLLSTFECNSRSTVQLLLFTILS